MFGRKDRLERDAAKSHALGFEEGQRSVTEDGDDILMPPAYALKAVRSWNRRLRTLWRAYLAGYWDGASARMAEMSEEDDA